MADVTRSESSIERAVTEYAKFKGCIAIKLSTAGFRGTTGWPDRLFLGPDRRVLWVEFKRPGKGPTPLQATRFEQLARAGWTVRVVDSVEAGKRLINALVGAP